jgi:hypothetical protein
MSMTTEQPISTCTICEDEICFNVYDQWNGSDFDRLDGWWSHHHHPADGHLAEPQPTAATLALKAGWE